MNTPLPGFRPPEALPAAPPPPAPPPPRGRSPALALAGLIALFVVLAYAVNRWPLQVNCVEFGAPFRCNFRALDMSLGLSPALRYYWIGSQGLPYYSLVYTAAVKLFSACIPGRLLSLRTVSVCASAAGLFCLYQTAARLFSRPVALIYLFLLVTSPKYLDMARSIGLLPISNAVLAAAAYATVASWNGRRVALKMFLLALLSYATLSLYIAARLIVVIAVAIFALYARSDWKKLALFTAFLAALILAGDLVFPGDRFNLPSAVLVHPEWLKIDRATLEPGINYPTVLLVRMRFNLEMLTRYLGLSRRGLISPDGEKGEAPDAMIPPVYIPLLVVGLLVCGWKRRKSEVFLLIWLGLFLVVPLPASVLPPRRVIYMLNPVNLTVALGIWYVYTAVSRRLAGSRVRRCFRAAAAAALCGAGILGIKQFVFKEARPGYGYSRAQLARLASHISERGKDAKAIRFNRLAEDVIWGNPYFDKRRIDIRVAYKFENDAINSLDRPENRPAEILAQIDYARREGGGILYIHVTPPAPFGAPGGDERWRPADIEKARSDYRGEVEVSQLDGMKEIYFMYVHPTPRRLEGLRARVRRILALAWLALLAPPASAAEKPLPPLVILFSFDTLRADHLSCYGYSRATSPALDGLARDGILFSRAISQSPLTAPSHATMLTSLTPAAHRVSNPHNANPDIFNPISPAIPTLPAILREKGFRTVGITGGGVLSPELGFDRGFDDFSARFHFDFLTYYFQPEPVLEAIRKEVEFSRQTSRPLFLFLHHYLCHEPYIQGPPEYLRKFLDRPVPGLPLSRDDLLPGKDPVWGAYDEGSFWRKIDFSLPAHVEHTVGLYDGSIAYADRVFGRLIEILKAGGAYDSALIVVTADHGEEFNEHGGKSHGRLFIEHLHVPLIIKLPGLAGAGRRYAHPVELLDVMPTILDCLSLPIPPSAQGVSLRPALNGEEKPLHPAVESYALFYRGSDPREMFVNTRIERGDYAYNDLDWEGVEEWLFNIRSDPAEKVNLAGPSAGALAEWRKLAGEYAARNDGLRRRFEAGEKAGPGLADDVKRQLKALGYITN